MRGTVKMERQLIRNRRKQPSERSFFNSGPGRRKRLMQDAPVNRFKRR